MEKQQKRTPSEIKYEKGMWNSSIPDLASPSVLRSVSLESESFGPYRETTPSDKAGKYEQDYSMLKGVSLITKLKNAENDLRESKAELRKLKEKHKAEIREIIGNTETADLFIALNAEVQAAKKKAEGLEVENNRLRLRIARMEQADAKKGFDFDTWNTIAMKGGNVTNMELNNLTTTITELRATVSKLTRDVEERDLKLQETWLSRAESAAIEGYQSMTVDELRETLKLKERLVAELRTMKSEYHQQIKDMRARIDDLENDGSGRGRLDDHGMTKEQGNLVSLRAKNDALEKMLEGFMRTLKNIRAGGGMDMTVGGAYNRTKASFELCHHLSMDTPQLKSMTSRLDQVTRELVNLILGIREKSVTCKEAVDFANDLLNTQGELIDLLDKKVSSVNDPPLLKDLRAQLLSIPRPLNMVLVTLRHLPMNEMIDYDLALDSDDVHHLKSEMKMMQVKLAKLETENAGLAAEVSLLESGTKMTTGSVGYRLALLRQQYKDRIAELELTIEEVLKQAEDELNQAYLEVRQMQSTQNADRSDKTDELDAICALSDQLSAKLRAKDEELNSARAEYERRILVLMKNYEERIAELEILNDSLNDEVNTLKEEMDFLKEKPVEGSPKTKSRKKGKKDRDRMKNTLRKVQDEKINLKHMYNVLGEEAKSKLRNLQDEVKTSKERVKDQDALISELRNRLKRIEKEMAMESKIAMRMSEKIIDRLQKRLAEQERKIAQLGTNKDLLSDGEKRQMDAELAALHKDLRIKEVEIEEITADAKHTTERFEKEVERLVREKGTYRELCTSLKSELAEERKSSENLVTLSPKEKSRRQRADSQRHRDQVQKLTRKANTAEETIKNFRKKILTLTMEQETESDALVARLKNQKENQENILKQLRDKYETQIGDLIRNYEDRITKIRTSCEEKVSISKESEKSSIDQRLGLVRAQHAAYVKTLRVDHRTRVGEILKRCQEHLKERDRIIRHHDRSILATLPRFQAGSPAWDELESDNHRALDALQNQIVRIEDDLAKEDAKGAANERKIRELESSIVKLNRLFEASEARLKTNIMMLEEQNEALKKEYEEDLVALHEQKRASQEEKAAKLRIRWPRRRNVTLILSLRHDHYLKV